MKLNRRIVNQLHRYIVTSLHRGKPVSFWKGEFGIKRGNERRIGARPLGCRGHEICCRSVIGYVSSHNSLDILQPKGRAPIAPRPFVPAATARHATQISKLRTGGKPERELGVNVYPSPLIPSAIGARPLAAAEATKFAAAAW